MIILVTGGLGTIGSAAVKHLTKSNHRVVVLDIPSRRTKRLALKLQGFAAIKWGSIEDTQLMSQTLEGVDVVLHCASVLPPFTDMDPVHARSVNVDAAFSLLNAMSVVEPRPRLIYPSSVTVYGNNQHLEPPRKLDDPLNPSDLYSQHKIEVESLIKKSKIEAVILRLGVSLQPGIAPLGQAVVKTLFQIDPRSRLEFVHPKDVARAIAAVINRNDLWGRTLLIGGGAHCRITYRDLVDTSLINAGIGPLPEEAFGKNGYYTDWMDTTESQALLSYQTLTFEDYAEETRKKWRFLRPFILLNRPWIRRYLLSKSEPWKNRRAL